MEIQKKKYHLAALFTAFVFIFSSCSKDDTPPPTQLSHKQIALNIADYLVSQQNQDGAIPDVKDGGTVNTDSDMEYALIGLAAAYKSSNDPRYLLGLEKGIRWLASREEMTDTFWRGSWFYVYSSISPYNPIPTSPDDPNILDVRGVDATSALFVYLLYLHSELSGTNSLAQEYESHARAALDFVINHDKSSDGFFYSSWQKLASDGQWHLWPFRYTADQGDVYLGMQAGWLLYNDVSYSDVATHLKNQMPYLFFNNTKGKYATGIYEDGSLETDFDGFNGIFPQGYVSWVFGENNYNQTAFNWLSSCVQSNGSLHCYPNDPHYSLSASLYAMSATALQKPYPTNSIDWLISNTYDEEDGGIGDTPDADSEKYSNVAGFSIVALLNFPAFL